MFAPDALDMYVAFGRRRGNDSLHWIFVLAPSESNRCTWYHIKGGPAQGIPYKMKVEHNKRLDSFGIPSVAKICPKPASQRNRGLTAANSIPLQRFQRWTTELLTKLERRGLAPPGTGARFAAQIEPSRFEEGATSGSVRTSGSSSGGGGRTGSGSRGSGSMTRYPSGYPSGGSGSTASYPSGCSSRSSGSSGSWTGRRG